MNQLQSSFYFSKVKSGTFSHTDLVLNTDGSVYHLHLTDEHIADIVLLAGDQNRVQQISAHFDHIEFRRQNREFVTHTGMFRGKRITVLSTGIGTDNIDIVLNELYAAINIDPDLRTLRNVHRSLQIIRIGTSGALHDDIEPETALASSFGLGFDGLMYYYNFSFSHIEKQLSERFLQKSGWPRQLSVPYFTAGDPELIHRIGYDMVQGITASGTGFYGPQGRNLFPDRNTLPVHEILKSFDSNGLRITNFDMETSALYGLGRLCGFSCCTVNTIVANRDTARFNSNYQAALDTLIEKVLSRL
jgi:uridine phosphorylase